MPKYHLPNGQVYSSQEDLSPEDLDHLSNPTPHQPDSNPSILDKIGGWRGLLGGGIRAGSGILSAEGGPTGAAISGIGEGLAQLAEGSDRSEERRVGKECRSRWSPYH